MTRSRRKRSVFVVGGILTFIVIAVFLNNVSHATTTSFSIPDYSMWLHSGSFQVTVSASTLSNVLGRSILRGLMATST